MGVSGQRHAPDRALLRGEDPRYHWTGGWVGPRAGLGLEEKSFAPTGDRTSVIQSVVRHYTDWATPAPFIVYNLCKNIVLEYSHVQNEGM
jgi:hypothetical protein